MAVWLSTASLAKEIPGSVTVIPTVVYCAEKHLEPPVFASVVKAGATATEYALQCGRDFEDGTFGYCGDTSNSTMILTVGPSTMALTGRDETL